MQQGIDLKDTADKVVTNLEVKRIKDDVWLTVNTYSDCGSTQTVVALEPYDCAELAVALRVAGEQAECWTPFDVEQILKDMDR